MTQSYSKKSLVLLHGWAMHSKIWREFALQLAENYHVQCVDVPLNGNLDDITEQVLAKINSESFYLLGWSFGGTVALNIAKQYSTRVTGIILMTANPCFVESENWAGMNEEVFDKFAQQLQKNSSLTLQRFLALQLQGLPEFLNDVKMQFETTPSPSLSDLENGLFLLKHSDLRSVVQQLNCPITAILSDNDALVPLEMAENLQQLNSDLTLTVLNNAGHIPFMTQPQNCLNAIHAFLNGS